MPEISIITVCYNAEEYIEQTINSVIHQEGVDLEYIIIDGGSTDNTLEIIKKYESEITTWISEPDEGIADAMNKGLQRATGAYVLFLHADDYLYACDVLHKVRSNFEKDFDIFIFDVVFLTKQGGFIKNSGSWNFRMLFKGICHQGVLCSRDTLLEYGGFDKSFKICMDYDFFIKAYLDKKKALYTRRILSVMRDTGISSRTDWPGLQQRFLEEKRAHFKNAPEYKMKFVYLAYWPIYMLYRRVIYKLSIFDFIRNGQC